jgi:HSP20 family molecular chaperone IbpA
MNYFLIRELVFVQDKGKKVVKFSMDLNKVEEMIDQLMDSMMEKVPAEKQPFVMGFTINFNSEDLPIIEEMNEIEDKEIEKGIVSENLSNPLAEAHYFKEEIVVSFELPKRVSRKELKVDVTESSIVVRVPKHSFKRKIFLKEKINPRKFSSSFKNAFFELTFRKK